MLQGDLMLHASLLSCVRSNSVWAGVVRPAGPSSVTWHLAAPTWGRISKMPEVREFSRVLVYPREEARPKKKKNYHVGSRAISSKTAGMCPIVALVGSRSTHGVPRGYSNVSLVLVLLVLMVVITG